MRGARFCTHLPGNLSADIAQARDQTGMCTGGSQEVMLCVINESELEYTLERGLPLAEAHEWIARPTLVAGERVALSAEKRREMVPVPNEAKRILTDGSRSIEDHEYRRHRARAESLDRWPGQARPCGDWPDP